MARMTTVKLLAALQPDIVRANQKDDAYVEHYVEATREVIRRLAGPFRALQYARESKLLALLLYHGLTTGLGHSTLGEEYCGILQVAGGSGHMPGPRRRLLLALLLSVGPYVADRLAGRLDSAAEEEEGTAAEGAAAAAAAVSAATDATGGSYPDEDAAAAAAEDLRQVSGREAGRGPGSVAITTASAASAAAAATRLGVGARSGDGGGGGGGGEGGAPSGRGWLRVFLAAVVARWSRSWRRLVLSWPQLRPLLSYSGRLHLALFYTYGAYYSLAHRLAGVRYSLSMRPLQGRPSYSVLGVLLGLQLAVVAALQARNALRNMRRRSTAAVAAAAAATKRRTARRRQRPGAQGPGRLSGDGAGDEEGEEHLYSAEGEPAVFLEDEDGEEEEDGESDEAYQEEAEAEEGMERDGPTGSGQQPAGDSGVDTGRRGGEEARRRGLGDWSSGSSAGGVAVVMEGWEGVERQDDGGESGWEADIFGVASMSTSVQRQGPSVAITAAKATAAKATAAKATAARAFNSAVVSSKGPSKVSGADGGREGSSQCRHHRQHGGGGGGAVLPVLTSLRQCPLCLSPKSRPTSTPCGHTFCWACITTWCVEKPECPLCRTAVRLPQLVALYHTNC